MRLIFIIILLLQVNCILSQSVSTCSCQGLVDTDYTSTIAIFDKPLGKIKHRIKHNFKDEDFLVFTINKDSSEYFYLTLSYAIDGKSYTGWVKKAHYLGTYSRVYTDTMFLYSKASLKSKPAFKIPRWTNKLLPITACKNKWVYVNISSKIKGWLQEDDQCANPYSTCN